MLQDAPADRNMFRTIWDLGFHRLVPIVPPGAPVSERSTIHQRMLAGDDSRGKVPGTRGSDGAWRGLSLVHMESQEDDTDVWNAMGAGVGIKTGEGLIALDVDTIDDAAARTLWGLAQEILGPSHVRFGRRPKSLMLYEAPPETTYRQMRFATPTEPWLDDNKARGGARVEVLAEGRQFVAHGIHPGTGRAYTWPNGIPPRDHLTKITLEQLDTFMQRAAEALQGDVVRRPERADTPDQEDLRAPSWDALDRAVRAMPNSSTLFPSRDDYVKVAYAIKAAAPDGFEHEAQELYLDWCERWEDGDNDMQRAIADWRRAVPPFRVGFGFVQAHAPALFFDPVSVAAQDDMFTAAEEAERGPLYELLSIEDVENMTPPEYLIDRHLPEDGFGILYGAPGSKKSFLALDMALHLAYGLPDWHGDAITRKPGRGGVLYIAGEGARAFGQRVKAWRNGRMLPHGVEPDIAFLFEPVNFMRPEDIHKLKASIAHNHPGPLELIIVDTVSRSIPGADENLQKDMTMFVTACEALRQATGAFVLGVHHTGKAGDMRGSTVFRGQADAIFRTNERNGLVYLDVEKQKDGPSEIATAYRMDVKPLKNGASSLVPTRVEAPEPQEQRVDTETQQRILDEMQRAFEAGVPWGAAKQTGTRRAVLRMERDFNIPEAVAVPLLDMWTSLGVVEVAATGRGGRVKGYLPKAKLSVGDPDDIFG